MSMVGLLVPGTHCSGGTSRTHGGGYMHLPGAGQRQVDVFCGG